MNMWIDQTEIEQKALQVRQEYNIQTYGIKDIFSLLAQMGIDLIRYPFGKNKLLGFSTFFEGKKVIVSNSSEILSREIFTIAHELGHILYDFHEEYTDVKIDIEISEESEDISEKRAFYFANCFLMPEEQLTKYIKYELRKRWKEINALDIVRLQLEFQVSYAAMVVRLSQSKMISSDHKSILFDNRNTLTSRALFKKLDADERLLRPANVTEVPSRYLEYVTSNYEKGYIPYSSLENALSLIGMDSEIFKKEKKIH
ncbi:MAG: ImmA/IrrE family metallo-endopeptidase [Bacillales bacterium]|nr:ImmA/IrrE family metallo-endopeptidase [Bacillales bacterium]